MTAAYGRSAKVTVTVTAPASGEAAPTGTVKILRGSTSLGTATYSSTTKKWTYSIKTALLKPGSYTLTAAYAGHTPYSGVSKNFAYTVKKATPKSVKAPAVKQTYGKSATVRVTVSSGVSAHVASGRVTLLKGTKVIATGTLSHGSVKLTVKARALSRGRHTLTLSYAGDGYLTAKKGSAVVTVR